MNLKNSLSSLTEMIPLEADQEGLLRGGFAMIGDDDKGPAGQTNDNCDCDCGCNSAAAGCASNANCSCNSSCEHNTNCNCNCNGTTGPAEPTSPTNPTDGSDTTVHSLSLFMF